MVIKFSSLLLECTANLVFLDDCAGASASATVSGDFDVMSVERFADQPPSASPLPWTVPAGAKNAFI